MIVSEHSSIVCLDDYLISMNGLIQVNRIRG